MSVGVAPFGAFVESEPVGLLEVPRVPAGGSRVVKARFRRRPDGGLNPMSDAGKWREPAVGSSALSAVRRRYALLATQTEFSDALNELIQARRTSATHWAGNFDVHIGTEQAERHCSMAIRLEAGTRNMAMFVVGSRPGSFRFGFQGSGADWGPRLWTPGTSISVGRWTPLRGRTAVLMLVEPPADTAEGLLAVSVTQQSTGKEALVEFGFGVDCIPPGCFRSRE